MLEKAAADIGIVMNHSKEEHQVGFIGSGSVTSMRTLYTGGRAGQRIWRNYANATGSGYTTHVQLQQCSGEASPPPKQP